MRPAVLVSLLAIASLGFAADKKKTAVPGEGGNSSIAIESSVLIESDEIQKALGANLGPGYIVVRMKAIPKGDKPLRINPDDFTLLSRKNGDRCQALAPNQVAGTGALVIRERGPAVTIGSDDKPNPVLPVLESKILPDKETKDPVEGLLYFLIDGKLKAKDLSLIYKGPAGKLIIDY